ncbi:carbohydrate-binding domain-containing protein [Paucisalibacillus globulus]|uniref:carbohydrate-binding domain-containing protein n=1 Tax=Paucisalibacillus globulus TaxID=351095 RepID=UPI0004094DF0|nr:carbohydrate-binding domain-containing protein [Paucisalibacillus globulus]
MCKKKLKYLFPIVLTTSLLISGCSNNANAVTDIEEDIISNLVTYKDNDYYTNWQEDNFTYINLEGQTVTIDGDDGAVVEDNQILIRTTGTYVVNGTLNDGQIIVDAEDSGDVRLVLNGASINSSTSAPIFIKQADKTIISLEENTENKLTDGSEYVFENDSTDEPSATIYSKDDLTINGSGSLTVDGNYNDAIKSNDDLKITGGTFNITAIDDGIIGRDLLAIKEATITINAGGDGLKSTNDADESKGNIVLESGNYRIEADGDGIQAEKTLASVDGEYSIIAGGGSPETITNQESSMGGGMRPNAQNDSNPRDMTSLVESLLDGIEIPDDVRTQLKEAESMEEIQSILQEYPDIQKQIQENGTMRGPGMPPGNDTTAEGTTDNQNNTPPTPPGGMDNINGQTQPTPPSNGEPPQNGEPTSDPSNQDDELESSEEQGTQNTDEETISTKGVKARTDLYLLGGKWKIDSFDDAIHSNQDITISGGTINISTGDDGIHGDGDVMLNGGEVTIDKSLEGIEGINITVADGSYHIVAEDDGVNVNGGSDEFAMPGSFGNMSPPGTAENQNNTKTASEDESTNETEEPTEEGQLLIKGGYLYINANGDGLDSNTSAKMTGGTVIVYGPTNNGNAPLDYNSSFIVEGGTLIASGSSGMAQGISEESSQSAIMMTFSEFQKANTAVFVTKEKGEEVLAITPEKDFQSIVISTSDLELDQTYTFHSGGVLTGDNTDGLYQHANYGQGSTSVEFSLTSVMTYLNESGVTEGNSQGMMNGHPMGNNGMRNNNNVNQQDNNTNNN